MTYRLNQVQGALYQLMTRPVQERARASSDSPPLIFRNQIKRLMEIDRENQQGSGNEPPYPAFFRNEAPGKGQVVSYDAIGVYRLALALELVRFGFKQREVVAKIAAIRGELDDQYDRITAHVRSEGGNREITDVGSTFPRRTTRHQTETDAADTDVFLIVDPLETPRTPDADECTDVPQSAAHHVALGWGQLHQHLERSLRRERPSAFIVNLTTIATKTNEWLEHQVARSRGRS